jgi:hypothetical protein
MHSLAIAFGLLAHTWGDMFVIWAASIVWYGERSFSPDHFDDIPPRPALAARLLPIPLTLSIGGALAILWGISGAPLVFS